MADERSVQELLVRIEKSNRQQAACAKLQLFLTIIAAVCCVGVFLLVFNLVPQFQALSGQIEVVLGNLESVTTELSQVDLAGMVSNVDTLVTTSQTGVEDAMAKINGIDFETLNAAITDLAAVVEPLAKFFGVFK